MSLVGKFVGVKIGDIIELRNKEKAEKIVGIVARCMSETLLLTDPFTFENRYNPTGIDQPIFISMEELYKRGFVKGELSVNLSEYTSYEIVYHSHRGQPLIMVGDLKKIKKEKN